MSDILISVIVPIYNVEKYIEKCIKSICNQTYKNLQIILVDDGSTDKSGEICDDFSMRDRRIEVIHKKNGGLVSARKAGALIARGSYITNVDGDDWIGEERIDRFMNGIKKYNADMIYLGGIKKVFSYGQVQIQQREEHELINIQNDLNRLLNKISDTKVFYHTEWYLTQWCHAIKKEIYVKNQMSIDDRIEMNEDIVCMLGCILDSRKVYFDYSDDYFYMQRENSVCHVDDTDGLEPYILLYNQLRERNTINSDILEKVIIQKTFFALLVKNYRAISNAKMDYLFPYSAVKRKSKIVVYAAGAFGQNLVNAIKDSAEYTIVKWVDKNLTGKMINGYKIESIANLVKLNNEEYDYIVVTIMEFDIVQKVFDELVKSGINKEKIALMDTSVVNKENLEKILQL